MTSIHERIYSLKEMAIVPSAGPGVISDTFKLSVYEILKELADVVMPQRPILLESLGEVEGGQGNLGETQVPTGIPCSNCRLPTDRSHHETKFLCHGCGVGNAGDVTLYLDREFAELVEVALRAQSSDLREEATTIHERGGQDVIARRYAENSKRLGRIAYTIHGILDTDLKAKAKLGAATTEVDAGELATAVTIPCRGPGDTNECGFKGTLDKFLPNLTSMQNAIKCPDCGSTNNAFNSEHGTQMQSAMKGGPTVTEESVLRALYNKVVNDGQ